MATQYNAYGPVTEQNIEAFAAYANAQMNLTATAPEYLEELKKCRLIQHIVNFNGSNTKIESNNPVNFHLGNKDVTAEAWVYLRSGTGYHVILENAKFDNTKLRGMRLFVQDAKVYFAAFDGGTSGNAHVNTIGTIPLNQWVHIAATKHHGSSITYTIHINGTSVSLNTNNTDAPDGTGMTISQNVAIGYSKVNNTSYFNGHIRNVRIYNRRLTTTEIGANYNSGCISEPAITEGLIYNTRLDNGHGTTISDLAYPSTATLSNGTWEIKALPGTACLSTAELAQVVLCDKGGYRFSYNGKEVDNEVSGSGNSYDYGARIYNPRLGRWLSVDPLQQKYPSFTPYNYVANSPIMFVDPDGKRIKPTNKAAKVALQVLLNANPKVKYDYNDKTGVYSLKGNLIDYENLKGDAATLVKVLSSVEIVEVTVTTTSQTNNDQTYRNNTDKKGTTVQDEQEDKVKLYTNNGELKDVQKILDSDASMKKDAEDAIYNGADYPINKNETIDVNPTKSGNNWVFFDNKNKDIKAPQLGGTDEQNTSGRVLINGTNQSNAQNSKTLLQSTSEAIKK